MTSIHCTKRIVLVLFKREWGQLCVTAKINHRAINLVITKKLVELADLLIQLQTTCKHIMVIQFAITRTTQRRNKKEIWAIYYHIIPGPESDSNAEQHQFYPKTPDSWCKCQRDQMTNTNNYDRKKCLPSVFREKLKHIFDHLSSSEILSTCQRRLTQNQNESLNSVVWAC